MAKVTRSTMLKPDTAEALEVLLVLEGHRSVSSLISKIVDDWLAANPVDPELVERYRALVAQSERVTPVDLLREGGELYRDKSQSLSDADPSLPAAA